VAGTTELRLEVTRVVAAPPEVVFAMHTDPLQLARWWGPDGFVVPSVELDLRVGGRYRIEMRPPDGDHFFLTGEFIEIDAPSHLAYTFVWEPPDPDDQRTIAALSFREVAPGVTDVVVSHGPFATEQRRALHEQGWTETLERLRAAIADDAARH
jgi:uncharacterized protein YndB with AHSA1/START domain